jgi:hypothetical protein
VSGLSAALPGRFAASVIDQNAPHHAGRHGAEMRAPLPIGSLLVDKAEKGLIHESRRLQRMVSGFGPHLGRGDRLQLVIYAGKERFDRRLISATSFFQ